MRYRLPLPGWLAKKWDAVEEQLDYRILGAAEDGSPLRAERFRLAAPSRPRRLDGMLFYLRLPCASDARSATSGRRRSSPPIRSSAPPRSPGECSRRRRTPVIVEVHGDWRTFTRLYGSPARRLVAAPADRVAEYAVRRADATRAVSTFTARLVEDVRGRPPSAVFTAFSDLSAFAERPPAPLPSRPTVALRRRARGVQEHRRARRGLAARRRARSGGPAGRGRTRVAPARRRAARRRFPDRVAHHEWLEPEEVSAALDDATLLVLPSWPEGLGRVVIEAFARGRAVVATDAGGIPDLVTDGVEGLLVPPADVGALAAAIERVLADRDARGTARGRGAGTVRRVALDARGACSRDAEPRRQRRRGHRPLIVRLVFVTQTLDAEHPVLAQTLDLVHALAARSEELVVLCASVGRHGAARPTCACACSARTRGSAAERGSCARWRRSCGGRGLTPCSCTWFRSSSFSRRRWRSPSACGSYSGTRTGRQPDAQARDAAGGRRPERRPALVPARHAEGARDRPRDRHRAIRAGAEPRRRRTAAAPRAGPYRALEGLRHDAGRISAGARARARGTLEIGGPQLTDDERATAPSSATSRFPLAAASARATAAGGDPELLRVSDVLVSATQPRRDETLDKVVYEAAACGVPVAREQHSSRGVSRRSAARAPFRRGTQRPSQTGWSHWRRGKRSARPAGAELRRRVVPGHSLESWADAVVAAVAADSRSRIWPWRSSHPSRFGPAQTGAMSVR